MWSIWSPSRRNPPIIREDTLSHTDNHDDNDDDGDDDGDVDDGDGDVDDDDDEAVQEDYESKFPFELNQLIHSSNHLPMMIHFLLFATFYWRRAHLLFLLTFDNRRRMRET